MIRDEQTPFEDDEIKILTEDEANDAPVDLPPAGDARDDELARRTDALAEEAELRAEKAGVEAIDPSVFVPDRELQNLLKQHNMLEIENAVPGFTYCWVYTGSNGYFVQFKKGQGWQVVQGNDPECKSAQITDDTTRRIGDVILMRIPSERYDLIQRADEIRRQQREGAVESELREIAGKHSDAFKIHGDLDGVNIGNRSLSETMEAKATAATAQRMMAKKVAGTHVNDMLKKGTVPGL